MNRNDFKKEFGQNFLLNQEFAHDLVKAADLKRNDTVLEIGPGHGAVTEVILNECSKVIAVEIDERFLKYLRNRFSKYIKNEKLRILQMDILNLNVNSLFKDRNYKIIGSLPYNISKKIIRKFLECESKPSLMSFILQKEVAESYTAEPPKATFLSNYVKISGKTKFHEVIPKESFNPIPKVNGAIISIKLSKKNIKNKKQLIKFLKLSFLLPRKKLINNLKGIYHIDKELIKKEFERIGIEPNARASEVKFKQWVELFDYIKACNK